MSRRRRKNVMTRFATSATLCLLSMALLSGCFSLGRASVPPVTRYRLAYPAPTPRGTPIPANVQVLPLRSAAMYDRVDVVYREGAHRVETYNYRRWGAQPARMVRDLIERDLVAAEVAQAVVGGPSLAADYVLDGVVEEFEERVDDGCSAHVRIRFVIARSAAAGRGAPPLQRVYEADEVCLDDGGDDLASAMSRAVASISEKLRADLVDFADDDLSGSPR